MSRWLKGIGLGVLAGVCGALFALTPVGQDFEKYIGLKYLFKIRGPIEPPANVVVAAIHADTGRPLGLPKMPRDWSRTVHAQAIRTLVDRGASVIVFDLDLEREKSFEEDGTFGNAIANADRVVLYERLEGKMQPIIGLAGGTVGSQWVERTLGPVDVLADAAKGIGSFPLPKLDVAVYEFWTFKPSAGNAPTVPSLALQIHALRDYDRWLEALRRVGVAGIDQLPANAEGLARAPEVKRFMQIMRSRFDGDPTLSERLVDDLSGARADGQPVSVLEALARLYTGPADRFINFYGPPGTLNRIPYEDLVGGGERPDRDQLPELADSIVFVGFSDLYDPGQPDRFYTVFTGDDGVDLTGVEIMATAFANLLTDRTLRPTDTAETVLILLTLGLMMGAATYLLPALYGVPVVLIVAVLYGAAAQYLFSTADTWLPTAIPLLGQLPLALFAGLISQYLLERRRKEQVSRAISYYLPASVVQNLTSGGLDEDAINKVVYATCLATDMAGFSTIAERMEPQQLATFMNDYFDTLAAPLKRHGVDVTEFRADAIMCAWTAREADKDIRHRAALAAVEAGEAVAEFNRRHAPMQLACRVGLEAGAIYVGHAGGGGHFVYSIVGDCANAASRIESLNKQLRTSLLASDTVVADLDDLLLRPLGRFVFVGKTQPTVISEIVARRGSATKLHNELCDRFAEALVLFEHAAWAKASAALEAILRDYPDDGPSAFLLARSRHFEAEAPAVDDPSLIRLDKK